MRSSGTPSRSTGRGRRSRRSATGTWCAEPRGGGRPSPRVHVRAARALTPAQSPVTDAERLVATAAMLVGASGYAFIVGSLSGLVANLDPIEASFRRVMDSLNRCASCARACVCACVRACVPLSAYMCMRLCVLGVCARVGGGGGMRTARVSLSRVCDLAARANGERHARAALFRRTSCPTRSRGSSGRSSSAARSRTWRSSRRSSCRTCRRRCVVRCWRS